MAGRADPPGRFNPRYEVVSGGQSHRTEIYIARRYFNLSAQEWGDLPWWEVHALVEGLENEGVLKGSGPQGKTQSSATPTQGGGMDLTKTDGAFKGLSHRTAG